MVDAAIRPESPDDVPAIRRVHQAAFGGRAEPDLVDTLRNCGWGRVSLVAELDRQVVGHVLFSAIEIQTAGRVVPALALAPLGVVPACQNQGIGSALTRAGMDACREAGHRIVLVLGHAEYYPRFGFSAELAEPLDSPYAGPHFMAAELEPGALDGVTGTVVYSPPFGAL
jgi:putative acetyltransferase